MRFVEDGVDIPDELLWAQDDGRVVFFCGAGVSMARAELPSFTELTRQVLANLDVPSDDPARRLFEASEAIEEKHGIRGIASADKVFGQLSRSFDSKQIEKAVCECLQPSSNADLSAHRTILRLATLRTREIRLITTNFDRLFEQSMRGLQTRTRSNLPHIQYGEGNWGVVHLHGVVERNYPSPSADGLVLSSAEFGDAYLAMGWARDFVKQVLDHYIAVFVGYSADDPPIRYLLEGLQQSGGPANRAYAFQSVPDDHAVAAWDEKGVQIVPFDTNTGSGYEKLWESLAAWGERTRNPSAWREHALKSARKGPRNLKPHQRGTIAHIVRSPEGAQAFAALQPPMSSEWLCVFDPLVRYGEPRDILGWFSDGPKVDPFPRYCLDSDLPPRTEDQKLYQKERAPKDAWSALEPSPSDLREVEHHQVSYLRGAQSRDTPALPRRIGSLAFWIRKISHQPAFLWWACRQIALHPDILDERALRLSLKNTNEMVVEEVWDVLREYHSLRIPDRDRAYSLRMRLRRKTWHDPIAREYANLFLPFLKIDDSFRSSVPPEKKAKYSLRDFLRVTIEYSDAILTVKIPDEYIKMLIPRLRYGLELASELESRYSYGPEICSIEPDHEKGEDEGDDSFHRKYKLSGHVLVFVSLLQRLATIDAEALLQEIRAWRRNDYVFTRLRIWILGNLSVADVSFYAKELLQLDPEDFWCFHGNRDLLLGLARRWNEFSAVEKRSIERKILRGPKKHKNDDAEDHKKRSAFNVLNRIHWLHSKGCSLTFNIDDVTAKLQATIPDWKSQDATRAARSRDGGGGAVRIDTDTTIIHGLSDHEIVPYIRSLEHRPPGRLVEYDPFLGLSQKEPERALRALLASKEVGVFDPTFWNSLYRRDIRQADEPEFTVALANALISLEDERFSEIARSVSSWFKDKGSLLITHSELIFGKLWQKFLESLRHDDRASASSLVREDSQPDWVTEAINSAAGNLTELLVSNRGKDKFEQGECMPGWWIHRANELLELPGNSRRYALVIFGWDLNFFYAVDPNWTETKLLSVIENVNLDENDEDALLAGFFWRAKVSEYEILRRMKPSITRLVKRPSNARSRNLQSLAGILLAGWGAEVSGNDNAVISANEFRSFILDATSEFRRQILWTLEKWSERAGDSDRENVWSDKVPVFLRDVWPKQKSIRSADISIGLVELAFSQRERFPEIVEIIRDLVSKVDDQRIFMLDRDDDENNLASDYPEAMLELLYVILPEAKSRWPYGAESVIYAIGRAKPALRRRREYIELLDRT